MDGKPRNLPGIDDRVYPSGVPSVDLVYKRDPSGESGLLVPRDFQQMVKDAVALYYNTYLVPLPGLVDGTLIHEDDVFVVWFNKALQNWKATASTIFEDDRYFELTYDGDRRQLYIDEYVKKSNRVFILTPGGVTLGPNN